MALNYFLAAKEIVLVYISLALNLFLATTEKNVHLVYTYYYYCIMIKTEIKNWNPVCLSPNGLR